MERMDEGLQEQQWPLHQEPKNSFTAENGILMSNLLCLKSCTIENYISDYPKEADLKWSLFCAACHSYRFDSILKPFPSFFIRGPEYKEIERLREVIESCPPIPGLLEQLKENKVKEPLLDLLYWVLIQLSEPSFKLIPKEEHQGILSQVPSVMAPAMPDYIFKITYGNRNQQKFLLTALNRVTKLAYHGSRLENFFSIVNHGLQVSFNKRGAFGPGTYLTSEMGLSLSYSPVGFSWNSSSLGSHISIVALCEVIDHPDVRSEFDARGTSKTNLFDIYDNTSIPGKYFIVENNDLVRVRYLLVYSTYDSETAALLASPTILGWIKRHKMFTFVLAYIILLLAIGSSNSSLIYKYCRRFFR